MSRKLTKVDFARIWGEVSKLSDKDWSALVLLRQGIAFRVEKTREPRKPKPGSGTVTVDEADAVAKKMGLRGPKSGMTEGGA